jgi:hypothetical protein
MNRALILLPAVALVLLTTTVWFWMYSLGGLDLRASRSVICLRRATDPTKYGPWLSRAVLVDLPGLSKRRLAIMFPSIATSAPRIASRGLDDRDPVG